MTGGGGAERMVDGVLITRPLPAAEETATRLAARGFRPIIAPLLEIRAVPADLPASDQLQAIVVTSGHAVAALPEAYRALPLLAVGDATAARARAAGHVRVLSAAADAAALAALAGRACAPGSAPLLLAVGRDQGADVAADLAMRGFTVIRREVYAAATVAALPEAARLALGERSVHAALFFSAATARGFVRLCTEAGLAGGLITVEALAISPRTAAALAPLPFRRVRVALHPNQDELLALLA